VKEDELRGRVARLREMRNACRFLFKKLEGKTPFGKLGVVERIILRWILRK
jgi:hypothetical protein